MPRKYIPHPPTGYVDFLTFIIRLIRYSNNVYMNNENAEMGINQEAIRNFLDVSIGSINNYIKKAENEGLIKPIDKKKFSSKQKFASKIYSVNCRCVLDFLNSKKIVPFADETKAKQQIIDFGKSLKKYKEDREDKENKENKEDREDKENKENHKKKVKRKKALEKLKDPVHNHFNNVLNDNNCRLYYLGLADYADLYLDDYKLRATNCLCNTKNPDNHINEVTANLTERFDMLREMGIENPIENDVNGSIYRLTYNLSHNHQLPQNVDIYELFWQKAGFMQEFIPNVRNSLKVACMPIYMMEQGIYTSVINHMNNSKKKVLTKNERIRFEAYECLMEYTNLELIEILNKVANAMHEVLGVAKFYGRDIFLYESDLHAEMKSKLLDMDIIVLNCYDGFYGEKGVFTEEIFYSVYYNAIEELKKYICIRDGITQKELPSYLDDEYFAA